MARNKTIYFKKNVANKKADKNNFIKFVNTIPKLNHRYEGRYAKFSSCYDLNLTVKEHKEIYDVISRALLDLPSA